MKSFPLSAVLKSRAWLPIGMVVASLALGGCGKGKAPSRPLSSLSAPDREMLVRYETIRGDLAKDDFRSAKREAEEYDKALQTTSPDASKSPVAESVKKIAITSNMDGIRQAFKTWSDYAITLTAGVEGFYVIHCPVPGCGDWLQTNTTVDNPYMGKVMHDCGEVQK